MARITDVTFLHHGTRYSLSIDFDDAALVKDTIAFDVIATRSTGRSPAMSITARVAITPAEGQITVSIGDEEVLTINALGPDSNSAEELVEGLPGVLFGGDPILGCAIKAGVSAIIGQAIRCFRSLEADRRWSVMADFLRCMAQHFGSISSTAMFRAFKCILSAGT